MFTFTSSIIFKNIGSNIENPYNQTSFPQLHYYFNSIKNKNALIVVVGNQHVFARGGSSEGYNLFEVFGVQLPYILSENIKSRNVLEMTMRDIKLYLLRLVVSYSLNRVGDLSDSKVTLTKVRQGYLSKYPAFF